MLDEKFLKHAQKCSDICYEISSARDLDEYLESEDIDICEVFSAAGYIIQKLLTEYSKTTK